MNKLFVLSALAFLACVSAAPSGEVSNEWKKNFEKYAQECKSQENANDEDMKIFTNTEQMPVNEVQSCLLKCADSKIGLVKDGKFNHDTFMAAAKYVLGDNKAKLDEAENLFKKCEIEVEKKSAEKCGSGTAMRACFNELKKLK